MKGNFPTVFIQVIRNSFLNRWYLLLPAILIFTYIVLRACKLALTWDEANTFFEYVRNPNWLPHDFNYMAANNHLLNTWLMKCSVGLFGESELALRLPNVLAGGFYFVATILLVEKLFKKHWQILFAFLLLASNPFILDFFSVARGYGISMALLMGGLLQITYYIFGKHEMRNGIYSQLFFVGALLANLTCIYLLLAVTFLLILNRIFFHRADRLSRSVFFLTLIPALALILLLPYLSQLKHSGAFFYGEESKSLADTFLSLSKCSIYGAFYSTLLVPIMTILCSAIPLISVIHIMRNAGTVMKSNSGKWVVFVTLTLFFTIVGPLLQHVILKTNFLSGRTAIFYLPLICFNFLGILVISPNAIRNVLMLIAGIFSILHFGYTANVHSFYDWKEQADVKEAMLILKKQKLPINQQCFAQIISTDLPFEKQINYYRMRFDMKEFGHAGRNESVPLCSYYYLPFSPKDSTGFQTIFIDNYFETRTRLFWLEDKRGTQLKFVKEVWQDFEHEDPYLELKTDTIYFGDKGTYAGGTKQYSISVPIVVPDSISDNLVATVNCRLYYYTRNTSALLVFGFDNGKEETWEGMHITELPEKPGVWSITGWTRPVPPGTKKIRVYLWNRDKTPVLMDNVALRLLSYPQ